MKIRKEEIDDFFNGGIICGYVIIMVYIFRLVYDV